MGNQCVKQPVVFEPEGPALAVSPSVKKPAVRLGTPTLGQVTNTGLNQQSLAQRILGDIEFTGLIGVGGYGRVYKAVWDNKTVAVKVVVQETGQLDNEAEISQGLKHPNVVGTFIYTVKEPPPSPLEESNPSTIIVMEYCDRGGLRSAIEKGLFKTDDGKNDLHLILLTLRDIATGLQYLHSKGIMHADLNTNNVLLSSSSSDSRGWVAKVADFGLSRTFNSWSRTHKSTQNYGTLTHVPPEVLCDGKLSPSADKYAFGIIMYEIWTGSQPFNGYFHGQLVNAVCAGERPQMPDDCPVTYCALAKQCWNGDKLLRPDWKDIIQTLIVIGASLVQS